MRRIGNLPDRTQAQRFCDYLMTLAIESSAEQNSSEQGSAWDIWIRDETDVQRARDEFAVFVAAPDDQKYQVAEQASRIREERVADHQRRLKNQTDYGKKMTSRTAMSGPLAGVTVRQQNIPVTIGIIIVSVLVSFSSGFSRPRPSPKANEYSLEQKLHFELQFVDRREYVKTGDPFASVKHGEVWRLVTPTFMHGSTFHLAFNMIMLFFFGSAIERLHGSLFMGLLVLVTGAAGTLLQVMLPDPDSLPAFLVGLSGTPFAIGASGAVYGLFGFLLMRPVIDPAYPIRMVPINVAIMLGFLVFCMTPMVQGIANGAHLGGLIAGMLAALVAFGHRR
jgi:GlpG protein